MRKRRNLRETSLNLHCVFKGNPGTGKTTVARLVGPILRDLGLLKRGHVVEVGRAELVSVNVGGTEEKIKSAIEQAMDGVLFIDEAYALNSNNGVDYGKQVVDVLVQEMENRRDRLVVICAGYTAEMNAFLESNPGLKGRFGFDMTFDDYTPEDMVKIARAIAAQQDFVLSDGAVSELEQNFNDAYRARDRLHANGRYARLLIERAIIMHSTRCMDLPERERVTQLSQIVAQDIIAVRDEHEPKYWQAPIDEPRLKEAMDELNAMVGLDSFKQKIHETIELVRYARRHNPDYLKRLVHHWVFSGNPGTGKTTVARILANIYGALGLLERGHLHEVDRSKLVAGFVGQTALNTADAIERAMGGVLFIDEAYALVKDAPWDFGPEAIETLLKKMEDCRGQFVVVAAGYTENMAKFVEANPGLRSRFTEHEAFSDYAPAQLMAILEADLDAEGIALQKSGRAPLERHIQSLYNRRDPRSGNARDMRKLSEALARAVMLRQARDGEGNVGAGRVTLADVRKVLGINPERDEETVVRSFDAASGSLAYGRAEGGRIRDGECENTRH